MRRFAATAWTAMAVALCCVPTIADAQTAQTAQPAPGAAASPSGPGTCPASAQDMSTEMLYGTWQARFDDAGVPAIVTLGKHPDYDGVRGTISREGVRSGDTATRSVAQLAGDIDTDGQLAIDESQDGHSISGVWVGTLQPGSCGKEFRGTWRNAADESTHAFVLNKTGPSH